MIHPNVAAASLGFATSLQDKMLAQQAPPAPQEAPQSAPQSQGEGKSPETTKEPPKEEKDPMKEMELMFTTKLDEIRQELKKDNQREIDQLKETITSALAEEDKNEPTETTKSA